MCGIAGIISKNAALVNAQKIRSAVNCLRHRGPEEEGLWINNDTTAALGHRRLRIIDLGREAAQPMHYLKRYSIVHNGELYNYIEIKKELQQKGYSFTTQSDTEVIVAAFAAYGNDCLQKFDGMFAFAIWDDQEKQLFAARDRFGEKPFFFFYDEEQLVFASELKALWEFDVKKQVNESMLYNFFAIGYTSNPTDPRETFYKKIYKLPAAGFLSYSLRCSKLAIEKYWQVYPGSDTTISEETAIEQFRHLFKGSVQKRLRSDVSVGSCLSGGLDSSAVVAFCDQTASGQYSYKCFTASFESFEKDELKFAKIVAEQFGLEHHVVQIEENNLVQLMNEVMRFQEEPVSSASVLTQYKLYQSAKKNGVTVLLDGQGADEILAGYQKYYKWFWQELYRNKQLGKTKEITAAKKLGVNESFSLKNKIAALLPQVTAGILQSRKAKQAFQNPDFNRDFAFANKREFYYSMPATFDLNGALYFNSFVIGLEELLRFADRNSMANAAEIRLPFLDHKLVEFLFTLPPHFKIHNGWTKWLLRKSVDDLLPKEIVWRKDKVGFEPPQKLWMQNREVQIAIQNAKEVLMKQHILSSSALAKKIQPHDAYVADGMDWRYWSAAYLFGI